MDYTDRAALIAWVKIQGDARRERAKGRREAAEAWTTGTEADHLAAHKMAQRQAGRQWPQPTPTERKASALREVGIALLHDAEAAKFDAIAALLEADGKACVIGRYCHLHRFVHGAEAEELRERMEALNIPEVSLVLEGVDARDSAALPAPPVTEAK